VCCFRPRLCILNLGAKPYWPVYGAAAKLGCPVVHGGGHWDLGMETMNVSTGANAIGHPMSLAIALAEMVLNNPFERFSGLRVAYLEGVRCGFSWPSSVYHDLMKL
jgi:predicted TIM-barrel fold metal-dependent hydrolase